MKAAGDWILPLVKVWTASILLKTLGGLTSPKQGQTSVFRQELTQGLLLIRMFMWNLIYAKLYFLILVYVGKFLHLHKLSVSVSVIFQIPVQSDTTGVTQSLRQNSEFMISKWIKCILKWKAVYKS